MATRTDLTALGVGLSGEMSMLRSELRGEMAVLSSELRGEMADLRGEKRAGNAELLRTLFFAMVASNATLAGLVLAAVKLA